MQDFNFGEFIDYYEMLGLDKKPVLDPEEIRKAYRQKSKNCHPDVLINVERLTAEEKLRAENAFKLLTKARDVLINPEERKKYDKAYDMYYGLKKKYDPNFKHDVQDKENGTKFFDNSNTDVDDFDVMMRIANKNAEKRQRERNVGYSDLEEDVDSTSFRTGKYKFNIFDSFKNTYHVNREKSKANNNKKIKPMTIALAVLILAGGITAKIAIKHNHDTAEAVKEKVEMYSSNETPTPSSKEIFDKMFEEKKEEVVLWYFYEVGEETLSEISEKTGQSIESIKRDNNDNGGLYSENSPNPDHVQRGSMLKIKCNVNKEDLPSITTTITITKHDGEEIARENRLSFVTLQLLNPNVNFQGKMIPSNVDSLTVLDFEKLYEYIANLNNHVTSSR